MKKALGVLCLLGLLSASSAQAAPIQYSAALSGAAEASPNASPGTGFALVTFDSVAHLMRVQVTFQDLVAANTASHIHCCTAVPFAGSVGVATITPTFTGFPTGATSGTYDHTFDMTLPGAFNPAFVTANGGTFAGAEAKLAAGLAGGQAYLNIHSSAFPGGEIRGFLTPVPEPATLGLLGLGLTGIAAGRRRRRA